MADNQKVSPDKHSCCLFRCFHKIKFDTIWIVLKPVNLMIFMLLFGFTVHVHFNLRENLIYKQICKHTLHHQYVSCYKVKDERNATAENHQDVLDAIKSSTTHVFAMLGLKIIFQGLSSCLLCSWSDRCGRKLPLLIALVGENIEYSSFFFKDAPFVYFIWGLYFVTIVSALFGGYVCIIAMCFCYLADNYPPETRALTFTMLDFAYMLGMIGGVMLLKKWFADKYILMNYGALVLSGCVLMVWSQLTFSDKDFELKGENLLKKMRELVTTSHLQRTFDAATRFRSSCQDVEMRLITVSAIPVMISYSLVEGVILSSKNHADLFLSFEAYEKITLYFAIYSCFMQVLVVVIYQCLTPISDSTLGLVGFWALYLNLYIQAFATDYFTFIIGLVFSPAKGFALIGLRSAYSKIPTENERGTIFFWYCLSEVSAKFFGYMLYHKLRLVLIAIDDILPHMVMGTCLIIALCSFTFQKTFKKISELCETFYREIHSHESQSLQNASSENNSKEEIGLN